MRCLVKRRKRVLVHTVSPLLRLVSPLKMIIVDTETNKFLLCVKPSQEMINRRKIYNSYSDFWFGFVHKPLRIRLCSTTSLLKRFGFLYRLRRLLHDFYFRIRKYYERPRRRRIKVYFFLSQI